MITMKNISTLIINEVKDEVFKILLAENVQPEDTFTINTGDTSKDEAIASRLEHIRIPNASGQMANIYQRI